MPNDVVSVVTQYAGDQYSPSVGRNAFSAAPKQFSVVVDDSSTPVVLGPEDLRMRQMTFVPASGNAGSVFIQVQDLSGNWVDAANGEITNTGKGVEWDAPANGHYSGQDLRLRADNDGDGVDVLYS